jgi:hypothetical protein
MANHWQRILTRGFPNKKKEDWSLVLACIKLGQTASERARPRGELSGPSAVRAETRRLCSADLGSKHGASGGSVPPEALLIRG